LGNKKGIQMEEMNELAELLGAYHHSKSKEITDIPKTITRNYDFEVIAKPDNGWRRNDMLFSYSIDKNKGSGFYDVLSNTDKNLILDYKGTEEDYTIKVAFGNKALNYKVPESIKGDLILMDYLKIGGAISQNMKGSVEVIVNTNAKYRRDILKDRLRIPRDLKKYVQELCAAGAHSSSGYSWYRSARGRLGGFKGTLLNNIWHMNKPVLVETANRLYGLNIRKSYKLDKIHDMLKNVPYTDLGIKDVSKLQELEQITDRGRYTSDPETIHDQLDKLGIGERPVKKTRKKKDD
jgi:hypothetical protein